MTKEIIAVDIDDVLAQQAVEWCAISNSKYGTQLNVTQYHERWNEIWSVTPEEEENRRESFFVPEIFGSFKPIADAPVAVSKLAASGLELVAVTKRRVSLQSVTAEWLDCYFPGSFSGIVHATYFDGDGKKVVRGKELICQEIGAKELLDDQLSSCLAVANVGIQALLFGDYGWHNPEQVSHKLIEVVKGWNEVLEYHGISA